MASVFINTLKAKEGRVINGIKRTPGPTYQEIRNADPVPGPDELYGEHAEFQRPGHKFSVPNSIYLSAERAEQERKKVFPNTWLYACRVENIQEVGSVFVYDFLDESILITRVSETEIRAYRNSCPHRGNQLRKPGSCGVVKKFFCPFHGGTWNLDGTNAVWPFRFDFPHLDDRDGSLPEVGVGEFQGFVFIRLGDDPRTASFDEFVAPLKKFMDNWSWESKYQVMHLRKPLNSNWKLLVQAFNEGIHIPVTHPQGKPFANVAGTQHDVLSDYITRAIGAVAVPGDAARREMSEYEVLAAVTAKRPGVLESLGIEEGSDVRARDVFADLARARYEKESGTSLPDDIPTTTLVDNMVFHLFPNTWIIHGLNNTGVLRATPTDDPDRCYFDIMWFHFEHTDNPHPPAPPMIVLEEGETFQSHWNSETIGGVDAVGADQDTDNLEGQQRGLRANPDGETLFADYLESAIIQDMRFMDELIERDEPARSVS